MQRTIIALICAVMLAGAAALAAHDEYRIVGTVTKVTANSLSVKQAKDFKVFIMKTDANTLVTRDKKKVARTEIKTGGYVVVDALGDTMADLLVIEVKLVPPPTAKE